MLGVHIGSGRYKPPEIAGRRIITWGWDGIGNWINRL